LQEFKLGQKAMESPNQRQQFNEYWPKKWQQYKSLWRWRFAIFFAFTLIFLLGDSFFVCPNVYVVTVYLLLITLFVIFVHLHYHEPPQPFRVPKLRKKGGAADFKLSEILLKEFEYVQETATQAMSDRLTLVNYFLLSAGVVMAGFGLMVSAEGGANFAYRYEVVIALSLLFNAVGWVYFMQIVRLRQAWCDSARAMNHLKVLFVRHCKFPPETAKASFRWKIESIPRAEKKMTVFYLSALLISLINATAIGLASIITLGMPILHASDKQRAYLEIPWQYPALGFILALYHLVFQMSMYTVLLQEPANAEN
jgi:hypothetical protein